MWRVYTSSYSLRNPCITCYSIDFQCHFIKQTSCFYYIKKRSSLYLVRTESQLVLTDKAVYCIKNRKEKADCKQIISVCMKMERRKIELEKKTHNDNGEIINCGQISILHTMFVRETNPQMYYFQNSCLMEQRQKSLSDVGGAGQCDQSLSSRETQASLQISTEKVS